MVIKVANKDAKIYAGRSTTVHNLLICAHKLCMNYITRMFLLVNCLVKSKQPIVFSMVKAKKANKSLKQRDLSVLITIPLY